MSVANTLGILLSLDALDKFCKGGIARVSHQKLLGAPASQGIYIYFATLYADYGACASVERLIFLSASIAEDDDDFPIELRADKGLQSLDPICQRLHVGLSKHATEISVILASDPGHANDHKVSRNLESVHAKLERVPWTLKPVGTDRGKQLANRPQGVQ